MKKIEFLILFFLLLTLFSAGTISSDIFTVKLQVRPKVEVDGKSVKLGDIADIQTKNEELKKFLTDAKLCEAPSHGRTFIWDRPYIESTLRRVLANKEKADDTEKTVREISLDSISIEGAKIVQISTKVKEILSEQIVSKAKEFIEQNLQENLTVEVLNKPHAVDVPSGKVELEVLKPNRMKKSGFISLSVQVLVDQETYTTIPVLLKIEQDSHSQAKLNTEKAILQPKFSENLTNKIKYPLVKPGETVILTLKMKSIVITALAKSLQKGAKGDLIRVMNLDSKKIIVAEVIDSKKVRVLTDLSEFLE